MGSTSKEKIENIPNRKWMRKSTAADAAIVAVKPLRFKNHFNLVTKRVQCCNKLPNVHECDATDNAM